jgi:hypothetical protein
VLAKQDLHLPGDLLGGVGRQQPATPLHSAHRLRVKALPRLIDGFDFESQAVAGRAIAVTRLANTYAATLRNPRRIRQASTVAATYAVDTARLATENPYRCFCIEAA